MDGEVVKTIAKVYVGGLTENVEKYHLEEIFERYGLVKTVWIARNPLSRGYAFVTYFDPKHAEEAVKGLNGSTLLGAKLKVQLSKNEIVKVENEQKDKDRDCREPAPQWRHRPRDRGRLDDRRRGRSKDRDRSPLKRTYDDEQGTRGLSPTDLDAGVIQESLMLREAVLRSGFSPYSFITNSLLQTAPFPGLPLSCIKSPGLGTTVNYVPYPHVVGETFPDLRQHGEISAQVAGPSIVLQTSAPPNASPSVAYGHSIAGLRSTFLQPSTAIPTPQYQQRSNPTLPVGPPDRTYSDRTSESITQPVGCTPHGNKSTHPS